jgi:GH24 family phage-related lysozyme (muramidase)
MTAQTNRKRYFPHLAGSLVLVAGSLVTFMGAWESGPKLQLTVYADKLAGGLPTVCNGLTRHVTKTPIVVGERWTEEKCHAEEYAALERVQVSLAQCFRRLPPQPVFDMASSHAWNNGAPNTCSSVAMQAWNAGDWELGCRRLSKSDEGRYVWSSVRTGRMLPNGKPEMKFVQGLANRRADETKTCLEGLS